jgi:hypothetical protein
MRTLEPESRGNGRPTSATPSPFLYDQAADRLQRPGCFRVFVAATNRGQRTGLLRINV